MKLNVNSKQWCDPTKDAGYVAQKKPSSGSKQGKVIHDNNI
jgi:hypothetical protein